MDYTHTQADDRIDLDAPDQFGRLWAINLEIKSRDAVDILACGWVDPLRTPRKYVLLPRRGKSSDLSRVEIGVERWLVDQDEAERDRKMRLYEEWIRSPQKGHLTDPEQDDIVNARLGPPPFPSVKALCAIFGYRRVELSGTVQFLKTDAAVRTGPLGLTPMTADDRRILGIVTMEDIDALIGTKVEESEEVHPVSVGATNFYEFMAAALKKGLNTPEAMREWKKFQGTTSDAEA